MEEEGQMSGIEMHERGSFSAIVARVRAGVSVSEAAEVRVTQVLEHARAVFDSEQEAAAWLAMPNPSLSGKSPVAWLDTDAGVHCVDDVLTRLEFGVYA